MKKLSSFLCVCLATTLVFTPGISDNLLAKERLKKMNIVEISLDESRSSKSLKTLSNNDSEETYYFIHNEGEEIDPKDIKDYIKTELKINRSSEDEGVPPKLMGVGVYKQDGTRHVDYIFDQLDEVPLEEIREEIQEKVELAENKGARNMNSLKASASSDDDTYSDSYTYRVRDNNRNTLAGVYTSNVDYTRRGISTLSGKKVSVWDVKFFNQTEPMNDYQTRELAMRYRHLGDEIDEQTIRSYGPYTTDTDTSVIVGLSGLVPSVSWTFNRKSANIIDESSLSSHYTKWVVDFALGTQTAKKNYVYEPGVRVTNNDAGIVFRHNHYINYYRNLDSQAKLNSGTIELILTDL
ncbi:hypothetical protein [Brevibacillus parabrevis]|uniref:hypothetical protein n=1 Tax=Brevibacillus parabrevis TaxID=54914 RepID=UPI0028535CF4|nr:hypothetical protein [Brevibacillus parabrevis]MDR5001931.1 hypothetical protein [Brevibacillus parabrevis]